MMNYRNLLFSCWLAVLPHLREPAAGSDSRLDHQEGRKKGSVQTSQGAVKETGAGGPPPSSPEGALTEPGAGSQWSPRC